LKPTSNTFVKLTDAAPATNTQSCYPLNEFLLQAVHAADAWPRSTAVSRASVRSTTQAAADVHETYLTPMLYHHQHRLSALADPLRAQERPGQSQHQACSDSPAMRSDRPPPSEMHRRGMLGWQLLQELLLRAGGPVAGPSTARRPPFDCCRAAS
jgi:hypothetical protein